MDSAHGLLSRVMDSMAQHFEELRPQIPSAILLTICALIPIYTGAHASLSRPSTAARPSQKPRSKSRRTASHDSRMEGLSPADALIFPVMTGIVLSGLYYLIKWMEDPALLNKLLNYYLGVIGIFSIWLLARDTLQVCYGYLYPTKYSQKGRVWNINESKRRFEATESGKDEINLSPIPGRLSRIAFPERLSKIFWRFREARTRPYAIVSISTSSAVTSVIDLNESTILATFFALGVVLFYNFVSAPWWLTNVIGFSSCYSALQLLSPTTFWTGTLVLTSLFFYDIYFVFFTPIMMEVATKLDIPVKLLIPRPADPTQPFGKQSLTLLGLGDIVLPGIMLGLALRFDLYMFYLKKQARESRSITGNGETKLENSPPQSKLIKAEYIDATGTWGERFWLDSNAVKQSGGYFPKPYFTAGITGYVVGMAVTQIVMHVSKHGQPALLYLVPGVLGSLWGTAAVRGEFKHMWAYTEDESGDEKSKVGSSEKDRSNTGTDSQTQEKNESDTANETASMEPSEEASHAQEITEEPNTKNSTDDKKDAASDSPKATKDRTIFSFSISLPEPLDQEEQEDGNPCSEDSKITPKLSDKDSSDTQSSTSSSFEVINEENQHDPAA